MNVPTYLILLQWLLLTGLGVLVIVLYRQLAYLLNLSGAVSRGGGLDVGVTAPTFEYQSVRAFATQSPAQVFEPSGQFSLVMFARPECVTCERMVRSLERLTRRERRRGLTVMAVTDSDPTLLLDSRQTGQASIEVARVDTSVFTEAYKTYATPFLYGIDEEGRIRSKGAVGTDQEIKRLMRQLITSSADGNQRTDGGRAASDVPGGEHVKTAH